MERITLHIESLIFSANPSISFDEIKQTLEECFEKSFSDDEIAESIGYLMEKYADEEFSMEIMEMAGGFRFMTKGAFHHTVGIFLKQNSNKKLSKQALETLSIIAYKQPVTKTEIETVRGVNCDYSIQKLLEKDLIEIQGRSDGPGRPLIYATSTKFTDYFGLKNINDLPKLKEIETIDHQIGEPAPLEVEQLIHATVGNKEEE